MLLNPIHGLEGHVEGQCWNVVVQRCDMRGSAYSGMLYGHGPCQERQVSWVKWF